MSKDTRAFIKNLSEMECKWVRALSDGTLTLPSSEESVLRWALSLARVSKIFVPEVLEIGHATDSYRTKLHEILGSCPNAGSVQKLIPALYRLILDEHRELAALFGSRFKPKALEKAVEKRPLALALSGGGGTSFVFTGAFQAFEEAGICPDAIAGSSMGAFLGLYRARTRHFDLEDLKRVAAPLNWSRLTQSSEQGSRFGLPASFRLNLHNVFGDQFQKNGRTMYLSELEIPFRATVSGIADTDLQKIPEAQWSEEGGIDASELKKREQNIVQVLLQIAKKPLKAIYLGCDELTAEFDVLDAIGFSAAVPGLFHYDVLRNDAHMLPLLRELMHQYGVSRFIDGGFVDNLPAEAAAACLTDPFVVALDSFSPNWKRHWLFLPLMHIAAETSRKGYEAAHLAIAYQHVLSPINVVPSPKELLRAIENGHRETLEFMPFIKKMLEPIRCPF